MPLIDVRHATTLDTATRRELVRALTEAYASTTGADAAKVWVLLDEVPRDEWGSGGRTLAARDEEVEA